VCAASLLDRELTGGRCERGSIRRNVDDDDCVRPDPRAVADRDVPDDNGAWPDYDVAADARSAPSFLRSSNGHVVENQTVVADLGVSVNDDCTLVSDAYAPTDPRRVVDLDPIDVPDERPQDMAGSGERLSPRTGWKAEPPDGVAVQEQGMKTGARWIAVVHLPILVHDRQELAEAHRAGRPTRRMAVRITRSRTFNARADVRAHGGKRSQARSRRLPKSG
jgi:hypothetical protein